MVGIFLFNITSSHRQESEDPNLERSFRGHKDEISGIAWNPNMKQAISSSFDKSLMVWNLKQSLRAYRYEGHSVFCRIEV